MPLHKHILFWVLALLALVFSLYILSGILLPFVAGLALAYLLDPLADRLERSGVNRLGATLLILALFTLSFILVLTLLVPILTSQASAFLAKLPAYAAQAQVLIAERVERFITRVGGPEALNQVEGALGNFTSEGTTWLTGALKQLWSGGQAVINVIALMVVTPVVAFYLLLDWDHMVAKVDRWLPRPHVETIRGLAREIDQAIAGFLRGQAIVCLALGTLYAIGLSMVGLNYGVLIGLMAGILSFIPYVGTIAGFVVGMGVALVQFWPDGWMIAATLAVFAVGQFIEGNVLSPKIVGESVGLHPVWVMFSLFAFGSLFGFVGLLLAVPLAAIIGVLTRFALAQYMKSPLYDPGGPSPHV